MTRKMNAISQFKTGKITGALLNSGIGVYDETANYSAGQKAFWNGVQYQVKSGQSVTGGAIGDLTASPNIATTLWDLIASDGYGFKNVSNMVYDLQGWLTSFDADGKSYTLTYVAGKLTTITDGTETTTITYNGDMFNSITTI